MLNRANAILLSAVLLIVAVVLSAASPVNAESSKGKCYTISSSGTIVYSNTSLTRKCTTLSGSDKIKVLSVSRGCCRVSFPEKKNGIKKGYIRTNSIFLSTSGSTKKVREKVTVYRRPDGKSWGSVAKGSKVTVLGHTGKYSQIRFRYSGSVRYGFVKTSKLK